MIRLDHLEAVTALTAQFAGAENISPDEMYKFVDFANRKFWRTLAPQNKELFIDNVTLSDGDQLPVDFTLWAGAAIYTETTTGGDRVRQFHVVHPEQLGFELCNTVAGAKSYYPGFYIADLCFYTVPSGIADVTIWYFNKPIEMYSADADDNTDDGMPSWIAAGVHQDAAQALRILSDDTQQSDTMLVQRKKEEIEANAQLFSMLMRSVALPVQQTVKGGGK